MKLFGFYITREKDFDKTPAIVAPEQEEGSINYDGTSGFVSPYTSVLDLDTNIKEERVLIEKYRDLVKTTPEVAIAVDEICSEAIITDDKSSPVVALNLDQVELDDRIKEMISESFDRVTYLLNFHNKGFEIFRNWYIDGRVYFHVMIDQDAPENGIQELRFVDPRKLKKVREIMRGSDGDVGVNSIIDIKEYYLYSENPNLDKPQGPTNGYTYGGNLPQNQVIKMTTDSIASSNSGIIDHNKNITLSFLHQSIRAANNLRLMEESMLIYRMTRAPERRVFYIDTGDVPRSKQEQYVNEIANKYRQKITYDSQTGTIKNDKRYLSMTEDYWIPRPSGQQGTQVDTLEGGQSVGETRDTEYFLDRLLDSMNVPKSRFSDQPTMFNSGIEVTRDELRFNRFINRLRTRFSMLFEDLLGKELILTQIMTDITYEYQEDNLFSEALKASSMSAKINMLNLIQPFVGIYFSPQFVYKEILGMNDEEIEIEQELIAQMPPPPEDQVQESFINKEGEDVLSEKALFELFDKLGIKERKRRKSSM
jgi:hypothetical protein